MVLHPTSHGLYCVCIYKIRQFDSTLPDAATPTLNIRLAKTMVSSFVNIFIEQCVDCVVHVTPAVLDSFFLPPQPHDE